MFGAPVHNLKNRRELSMFALLCFMTAASRILVLILEHNKKLAFIAIIKSLKSMLRGKLMSSNIIKLTFFTKVFKRVFINAFYGNQLAFSLFLVGQTIIIYYYQYSFSFTFIVGILFYSIGIWLLLSTYIFGIAIHLLITFYIQLRFKQVERRIEKSKSDQALKYAHREHNEICLILEENNYFLSKMMLILYFITSITIDFQLYLASHPENLLFGISYGFFAFGTSTILFGLTSISASMSKSAHSPYKRLNAIMIKRPIKIEDKLNMLNLIERLGGPDIATYCLHLFSLNMFEFHLLVINLIKNFLLIVDLFENKKIKLQN